MKTKKAQVRYVVQDWKANPGEVFDDVMKEVNTLLRRKGLKLHVNFLPFCEGSDTYGWMLSWEKLTRAEVQELSNKAYGIEED